MAWCGTPPVFKPGEEQFSAYVRRLEQFFVVNDLVAPDDKKTAAAVDAKRRAVLLTALGPDTFSLLEDLLAPAGVSDVSYAKIVGLLTGHFEPGESVILSRHRFHTCAREDSETVSAFLSRLRHLARPCKFICCAGILDEMLRDRFVSGIRNERLQSRLLSESQLTLTSAIAIATAHEAAASQAGEISKNQPRSTGESAVHRLAGGGRPATASADRRPPAAARGGGRSAAPCFRCRGRNHSAAQCPFRTRVCFSCGKLGHIRAACVANQRGGAGPQRDAALGVLAESAPPAAVSASAGATAARADACEEEACGGGAASAAAEEEDLYSLFRCSANRRPPIQVDVKLNDRPVTMELDTGAALSVCGEGTFRRLWPADPPVLGTCAYRLKTYSGEVLSVCGEASVQVQYQQQVVCLPLVIVEGDGPCLFGRNWLDAIKLDWPAICQVGARQWVDPGPVLAEFPEVFQEGLGCYQGDPVHIGVDPDVQPRFFKARTVPLAYRAQVDAELDKQISEGLWEPVASSRWAAPLVIAPKANGSLRICGDYRLTVNKVATPYQYPLPRVEELLSKLTGATVFSKIDLKSAYNQLPLDDTSRQYLTVNTHRGLLKPNRLSFGYSSAPALFQQTLETLLAGIPGVGVFLDDVVVSGADAGSHNTALRAVLSRLQTAGLRVNREKCQFGLTEVTYLGHKVSARGVETTDDKVRAILRAPEPTSVTELRSWLGVINYYGKFLKDLSTVLAPLYSLLRQHQPWRWGDAERGAFEAGKRLLLSPPVLAHFDPKYEVVVSADASPIGIGCVLSVITPAGERPVSFFSRTLNDTERRYSQTDREALAVVAGVRKFHYYLAGRSFRVQTDHKPLLGLIGEQKPLPVMASPRVVRWAMLLSAYDYRLEYRAGRLQGHCDALSRLPLPDRPADSLSPVPAELVHMMEVLDSSPVTAQLIRQWTARDPVVSAVYQYVQEGWPASGVPLSPDFGPYKCRESELSSQGGCVLWGSRVVIPPQGRAAVLRLLHSGHCGESRTKSFARRYVWWPNMDRDISDMVSECTVCQELRSSLPETPMHPWEWPSGPWQRVHVDYCGPFHGSMFLLIVDAHSKWMDVFPCRQATTEATLEKLRVSFACWGVPKTLVSDNAQCFVSPEFEAFCRVNGIRHLTSPPFSPKSNGLVERAVQTFKRGYTKQQSGSVNTKVSRFLFNYRTATHSTTHASPAELMLGRQLRTPLDILRPNQADVVRGEQATQKEYKDRGCRQSDPGSLLVGDRVYVSAVGQLRGSEGKKWLQGVLVGKSGVKFTVRLCDGRVVVRHGDRVRACRGPGAAREGDVDPDPVDLTSPPADVTSAAAVHPATGGPPGSPAGTVSPPLGVAGDRLAAAPPAVAVPAVSDRVLRPRPRPDPDRLGFV